MKVINLNQFKRHQQVELDGKVYTVRGITVSEVIDDEFGSKFAEAETDKDRVKVMVEQMCKLSDIPYDLLMNQDMELLTALMEVAQGNDPTAEKEEFVEDSKIPNDK
jgi:hypothetical protein